MYRLRAPGGRGLVLLSALMGFLLSTGCSDSPSEPSQGIEEMAGTYALTQLAFDPQGVLPEANILAALGTSPQLVVTATREAQVVYEDPVSGLFTTIGATVRVTNSGLRIDFNNGSAYSGLLFSRRMELTYSAGTRTLSFDADAPDGVSRGRLIQLVAGWAGEQLLDPVPGRLRVTFRIP